MASCPDSSQTMPPELSIIIVSYNCCDLLAACLDSIARSDPGLRLEVIVVDNASADATVAMLRQRFPQVELIVNDANLGFSVASNLGIRRAGGRYILLLNPDTEVIEPSTLHRFVEFMDANPDVGAAGGELVHAGGQKQVSAGYAPSPSTLFAFSFFLAKFSNNRIKGLSLLPVRGTASSRVDVDWICAACMIVRPEALTDVGLLDESYFLYGEDIEWGCRISRSGWKVSHVPSIRVAHVEAGTQKKEMRVSTAWVDGMARVYMELNPGSSWLYFKICLGAGLAMRAAAYWLIARTTRDPWPCQRTLEMHTWLKYLLSCDGRLQKTISG